MSAYWDRGTRWLHMGLAVSVSFQLFISLVMRARERPGHPVSEYARLAFHAHEWVGMVTVGIVAAHWFYSVQAQGDGGLRHLLPLAPAGRRAVAQELRARVRLRVAPGGPGGGLAGLIHGLGLLAAIIMVISGSVLFFTFSSTSAETALPRHAAELHGLVANLVWAYWYGHVGLAVLHEFSEHPVLGNIFRF